MRMSTTGAVAALALAAAAPAPAQEAPVRVEEVAPGIHLLTRGGDNLVVYAGTGATVVIGVQEPALVARAREVAARPGMPPVRYAVMLESAAAPAYGDAGWGRLGVLTVAHEMLHYRIERWARAQADSGRAAAVAHPVPATSFSEVMQLYIGPEEVHLVHPRAGYTDGDVLAHWEEAGVLYLGNAFTSDGYPALDVARRGSIEGLVATASFFLDTFGRNPARVEPIIPGRGPLATLADLRAYRDMLVAVRDRVRALQEAGKTLDEAVAAKPTAALDARWGRGPVAPDDFVAAVYRSLERERRRAAPAAAPAPPPPAPAAEGHQHGHHGGGGR